jgi:4,5-dihydroxyphthalate decarboxylase
VAAIVWIRDALESKYGVRPQDIRWVEERTPKQSHYRGAGYAPPAGVPVEPIPAGRNLAEMLIAGELDAVIRYLEKPKQMSLAELGAQPSVKWLYPERKAEGIAHCKAQGYFDPIHLMIMKKSLADANPGLAMALVRAFSKAYALSEDPNVVVPASYALSSDEQRDVAGAGFSPVGVNAHRKAMERLLVLAHREGYTPGGQLALERVFHESTLQS